MTEGVLARTRHSGTPTDTVGGTAGWRDRIQMRIRPDRRPEEASRASGPRDQDARSAAATGDHLPAHLYVTVPAFVHCLSPTSYVYMVPV